MGRMHLCVHHRMCLLLWFLQTHQYVHVLLALPRTFCHVTSHSSVSATPLQYQCVIVMALPHPFRILSLRSTRVDNFFCAGYQIRREETVCVKPVT
jgi:hypothetical protein